MSSSSSPSSSSSSSSSDSEPPPKAKRRQEKPRKRKRSESPTIYRRQPQKRKRPRKPKLTEQKYTPPTWSSLPNASQRWNFEVYKTLEKIAVCSLFQRASYSTFGRHRDNDFVVMHDSSSRLHAVIQYGRERVYLYDISAHGTKVNGKRIPKEEYVQLKIGDKVEFGFSSRSYVLQPDDSPQNGNQYFAAPSVASKPQEDWEVQLQQQTSQVDQRKALQEFNATLFRQAKVQKLENPENSMNVDGYRERMKQRSFQTYSINNDNNIKNNKEF